MARSLRPLAGVLLGLTGAMTGCSRTLPPDPEQPAPAVRGMNFCHYRTFGDPYPAAAAPGSLAELRGLGADWVALLPCFWQETIQSTTFSSDQNGAPFAADSLLEPGIERVVQDARRAGFKILLKPHLWVHTKRTPEEWHGTIDPGSEAGWQQWFAGYQRILLAYADFAAREQLEALSIGVELTRPVLARAADFKGLIQQIRGRYHGQLTYCANWYKDFDQCTLWGDLDFVAVDFFFPLHDDAHPDPAAVRAVMEQRRQEIEGVCLRVDKPYVLSEVGFRSMDHAYGKPWTWTLEATPTVNPLLQAEAYQLVWQVFGGRPRFRGLFWWYWHADTSPYPQEPSDFTPRGKPAAEVLRRWFQRGAPASRPPR